MEGCELLIVSFVLALYTCSCVFETNICACFSKKYAHNYLTQTCIVHINVHIHCGLNALSLIFTLFLFVVLFKYKVIDFIVYRLFTVVSKIALSNFCSFHCLVFGDWCVLSSV